MGCRGKTIAAISTMPRLAGQQPEYIESQLRNFAERSRDRDIFINMARVHGLSPEMRSAVAGHFRGLRSSIPSAVARATILVGTAGEKTTTAVMTAISYNLAPQQIDAIAAYLSYLR